MDITEFDNFSGWLKFHREKAGLSCEDLARLVGATSLNLASLEDDAAPLLRLQGRYKASVVRRIAQAVGGSETRALTLAGIEIPPIEYLPPDDDENPIHVYGQGWGVISSKDWHDTMIKGNPHYRKEISAHRKKIIGHRCDEDDD